MSTINQSRLPSSNLSTERSDLRDEPALALTPLERRIYGDTGTSAGGDHSNGGGQSTNINLDDAITLGALGPIPGLLEQSLQNMPFTPLSLGDTPLSLQAESGKYTVKSGDTLSDIAAQHSVSFSDLLTANPQITNPDMIHPGDIVNLPSSTGNPEQPEGPGAIPVPEAPPTPLPGGPVESGEFDFNMIAGVDGNANVSPEFTAEVEAMAERLGTKPEYIMAVMSFESAGTFSPSIKNPLSGATGLIQFIPNTARGLGTSTAELAQMSAVEQLQFVEKYFDQSHFAGKLGSVEGLYSAVLSGQAKPDSDDTLPNFVRGHRNYTQNAPLDINNDGRITSGEAASEVVSRLYGGVTAVQQQLVNAGVVPQSLQQGFTDGDFGSATQSALINFQNTNGLEPTGYLNDETGRLLFNLDGAQASGGSSEISPSGTVDLDFNRPIHERATPARQSITSPVIGDFTITEGFMARGGPHSSKSARQAIFSDNPLVAETVSAGVYNLGIDYVTLDGRIDTWFSGEVTDIQSSATGYGNRLIMKSDVMFEYNGQSYPVHAHYAHADSFNVGVGDRVLAGQDIGDQGSTGGSTGDHVDFHTWIMVDGQRITISPNLLAGG